MRFVCYIIVLPKKEGLLTDLFGNPHKSAVPEVKTWYLLLRSCSETNVSEQLQ